MGSINYVPLTNVKINDSLLKERISTVIKKTIPYQWKAINDLIPDAPPSGSVKNFRIAAGEIEGEFTGYVFQDSDVAKWIEGASYSLITHPDKELEEKIDHIIDVIVKAQADDGYLDTYFMIKEPKKRWTNLRDCHELYCAGHMIEAAVAYYEATGKRKLLDAVCRFADHIDSVFGSEEGKKKGYPGHEEVELALIKLYHVTGNEKYLNLSKYFIDERGKKPYYFTKEALERGEAESKTIKEEDEYIYYQAHKPVREQTEAVGHAVRAMYLYSGMTDVAIETGDDELFQACKRLWRNVTKSQMYITGGIGSSVSNGEAFTFNYDLPNDTAYSETCAAIGLVLWAHRMLKKEIDSEYADVLERALYNGVLSGISLEGNRFFYVNPLEVWPEACLKRRDKRHVKVERQKWYGCACCPPNIARLLTSIGGYIYSYLHDEIYVHLYVNSQTKVQTSGQSVVLNQETMYPWDGKVKFTVEADESRDFTIAFRIPGWCHDAKLSVNGQIVDIKETAEKGYARIKRKWKTGDVVELDFPMPVVRIEANPSVRMNSGKVAIQRGPIVYCFEEIDNGDKLTDIALLPDPEFKAEYEKDLLGGVVSIKGKAIRSDESSWDDLLYRDYKPDKRIVDIKAVPYYAWNNRGVGEMLVWIRQC